MLIAPRKFKTIQLNLSEPKYDYSQVEFLYCGICGGDYSAYIGLRKRYPISLGHEIVARIVKVNPVHPIFNVGDIVVSDFNYRCQNCSYCLKDKSHLCVKNNIQKFSNRGFADFANIDNHYLVRISPPSFLPRACLIEPLSCVIHACNTVKIHLNNNILIVGCGSIGTLLCFYLRTILGCKNITVHDVIKSKQDNVVASYSVSPFNQKHSKAYDLIFDCSNTINGIAKSLSLAPLGGKVIIISHVYGCETSFIYETICKKELSVCFPLRNGSQSNLIKASKYINEYWSKEFDIMLGIYDDVNVAFQNKEISEYNKQIIKLK